MKQPSNQSGRARCSGIWRCAPISLKKSLDAATNAHFEITDPAIDLLNHVTQKPYPVRVIFFRGLDGELIELSKIKLVTR